jgi:hypothetical protein
MPTKRKRKNATRTASATNPPTAPDQITPEHGVWHVFGLRVNLNTALTTLVGAGMIAGGSWALKSLGHLQERAMFINSSVDTLVTGQKTLGSKVDTIEKRQERFEREYAPPVHPSPAP